MAVAGAISTPTASMPTPPMSSFRIHPFNRSLLASTRGRPFRSGYRETRSAVIPPKDETTGPLRSREVGVILRMCVRREGWRPRDEGIRTEDDP